jgi:ABC-type multidrug transport system fused ATPase/permease subunit
MVPVMFTLFLCAEACNTGFFRVIAYYDSAMQGTYTLTVNQFWMTLGIL